MDIPSGRSCFAEGAGERWMKGGYAADEELKKPPRRVMERLMVVRL